MPRIFMSQARLRYMRFGKANKIVRNRTTQLEHMPNTTPTIQDLISLLDQKTLTALSKRLQEVARAEEEDPSQLLFSFIEEGLQAHEEVSSLGMGRHVLAGEILETLNP